MDRNITMLESVKGETLREKYYIKILFQDINSECSNVPDQNNLETINLSNEIYQEGLKLLQESSARLPETFQSANRFKVAYIEK